MDAVNASTERAGRRWAWLRFPLGALLHVAASLKIAGLGVSPIPLVGWFAVPAVQLAAAEWELLLGVWLLSGWSRPGAWTASVMTFSVFAGISGYLGWMGIGTCGCFGAIQASPWYVFSVDAAILTMLAMTRPPMCVSTGAGASAVLRTARGVVAAAMAIGGLTSAVILVATIAYGSTGAALAKMRGERISVEPAFGLDFGAGRAGELRKQSFVVVNRTGRPLHLMWATTGCSCAVLQEMPVELPPGTPVTLELSLEFPDTPSNFTDPTGLRVCFGGDP